MSIPHKLGKYYTLILGKLCRYYAQISGSVCRCHALILQRGFRCHALILARVHGGQAKRKKEVMKKGIFFSAVLIMLIFFVNF